MEPSDDVAAEFIATLPTAELLLADGPLANDVSEGALTAAAVGGVSNLLVAASRATREANSSLNRTLATLHVVIGTTDPVITGGSRAVWTGQPVDDRDAYTLIVDKAGESYAFSVYTRGDEEGATWRDRIFGVVVRGEDGVSRGTMWTDLDTDRLAQTEGKTLTLWTGLRAEREVTLVKFSEDDDGDDAVDWTFRFQRSPAGGTSSFTGAGPDGNRMSTVARWEREGSGRADGWVFDSDGTRPAAASVRTDCFGVDRRITFESLMRVPTLGDEPVLVSAEGDADTCRFATVARPVPGYVGEAPTPPERPAELE